MDVKEKIAIGIFWLVLVMMIFSVIYISSKLSLATSNLGWTWLASWVMLVLGVGSFTYIVKNAYSSMSKEKASRRVNEYFVFLVCLVSLVLLWIFFITSYIKHSMSLP